MRIAIHPEIAEWQNTAHELGMLEFGTTENLTADWHHPVEAKYAAIALDESDLLCIDTDTGELLVLDHEQRNRVLCKASVSQDAFLQAARLLSEHFNRCSNDDEYCADDDAAAQVVRLCTERAGGPAYASFFHSLVGV